MKKKFLLALMTLTLITAYSQEKGRFRFGLDFGYVPTGGGGGGLISFEPKYNLANNMNVGLRIGFAGVARDVKSGGSQVTSAKISSVSSFVGTYDYYFHKSGSSFAPYLGAGLGYYSIANVEAEGSSYTSNVASTGEMGGLIRGGFEWRKLRVGVEYNIVPDSKLQDINGNVTNTTVANSYVGLSVGFYLGGGKWGGKN